MATMAEIEKFGQDIGREFHPHRAVLFGSYAYGTPNKDSDVDILVVMPVEGRSVNQSVAISMRLRPPFPMDLLVRTPGKVRERLDMGDCFMEEILEKGKVLYEAGGG